MNTRKAWSVLCLCLLAPLSGWAYHCTITANGTSLTQADTAVDVHLTVTMRCLRAPRVEAANLSYRIKADRGNNPRSANPMRAVRLGATSNQLTYALRRATSAGAAATCDNTTNWDAPATGNNQVISGNLNFGNSFEANVTWSYCLRLLSLGTTAAWPAAGSYTDQFRVFAQYPGTDTGALSATVEVPVTVTVPARCTIAPPGPLVFNYTSFSRSDALAGNQTNLRCSSGLPWTASVDPNSGTLLGLPYTLIPLGATASPSGTGTGLSQSLEVIGLIKAGQSGTCAAATCRASRAHTLTITY